MLRFIQGIHWEKALSHRSDWINPLCMLTLGLTGVAFIYSAQSYRGGAQWITQIAWLGMGAALYVGVSILDYKIFLRHAHWLYLLSIVGLLALWTPLGASRFGALRWIDIGPLSFQPSESAKIGTLIMVASTLARAPLGPLVSTFTILARAGAIFVLPMLLIFLQPDLGSALVFPPMAFALLYVAKLSERFFLTAFVVSLLAVGILGWDVYNYSRFLEEHELNPIQNAGAYEKNSWVPLHDYQRNRILSFVAPEVVDPQGVGVSWNLRQSLIAIGSGGITGQGFGQSTQARLGYLPQSVAANDFIFAVMAEEIGFIGGILVIGLYALLACNCIRIASLARDRFGMLLCVGVSVILVVHALVNIGMTLGLMPITGLPLPFLSSGGSFVLSCCFLLGLVQSVYRFRKDFS